MTEKDPKVQALIEKSRNGLYASPEDIAKAMPSGAMYYSVIEVTNFKPFTTSRTSQFSVAKKEVFRYIAATNEKTANTDILATIYVKLPDGGTHIMQQISQRHRDYNNYLFALITGEIKE